MLRNFVFYAFMLGSCTSVSSKLKQNLLVPHVGVLGLHGKVLLAGAGYRGGFCEKLLEASPVSDRANASRLQDEPATSQGQAHQ